MGSSAGAFLLLKVYYLFATVRGKEIIRAFQINNGFGFWAHCSAHTQSNPSGLTGPLNNTDSFVEGGLFQMEEKLI